MTKLLKEREAELWGLSPTPRAHLTAMLQRVHFQIVPTDEFVLSEHKKHERRRRNLKAARALRKNKNSKKSGRKTKKSGRKSRRRQRSQPRLRSLEPVKPILVEKKTYLEDIESRRENRKQEKFEQREVSNGDGTSLEIVEKAKRELIFDRPFMFVLKCNDNILQIGRFSSPKQAGGNRDISNVILKKKYY